MAETKETVADVVAEMRRYGSRHWMHDEGQSAREFADRIEAAWKLESKAIATENAVLPAVCISRSAAPVGNAAAMYTLLKDAKKYLAKYCYGDLDALVLVRRIDAALFAPPRNCDVGTAEEQAERFIKLCRSHTAPYRGCDGSCPLLMSKKCSLAWAQMPYKEGGAK